MAYQPPDDIVVRTDPATLALAAAVEGAQKLHWGYKLSGNEIAYPLTALPLHFAGDLLYREKEVVESIRKYADKAHICFDKACRFVEWTRDRLAQAETMIDVVWEEYCDGDHQDLELWTELHSLINDYVRLCADLGVALQDSMRRAARHDQHCLEATTFA